MAHLTLGDTYTHRCIHIQKGREDMERTSLRGKAKNFAEPAFGQEGLLFGAC